jgi:hypothetical protein
MKKKIDEKILEEIRNRVIEKDQELKNEEEIKKMREANVEALTELTSLSRKEVEKIADQVKNEHLLKEKLRQKRIIQYSAFAFVVMIILFFMFRPKPELKTRIVEDDFTNNSNEWSILNSYKYNRYFKDNQYIYDLNNQDWCYWDGINLKLPVNCDIEVESKWLNGKYSAYGIALNQNDTAYYTFSIRGDGAACFAQDMAGKWVINDSWKYDIGYKGKMQKNVQKIEIRGKNFSYYVNNNLVRTGIIELDIKEINLRCCGQQQVAFDYIKVINADSKKVEFTDNFTNPSNLWNPKRNYTAESNFEKGRYILTEDNDNNCNWSVSELHQITDNCEIELTSVWLTGDLSNYGLMILNDDDNYVSCELQNNGIARFVESKSGKYTYVQNDVKTGFESDGKSANKQKVIIKGSDISYYVNDKLIKTTGSNLSFPCKIALRVCGKQSVAFDKLSIKYYE